MQMEPYDLILPASTQNLVQEVHLPYPVLRNIFNKLNDLDLESCCNVNKYWRASADRLVVSHFEIILLGKDTTDHEQHPSPTEDKVTIIQRYRYNRNRFTKYNSNFEGAVKILEYFLSKNKNQEVPKPIYMSLSVSPTLDIWKDKVQDFFSKFGPLISDLAFTDGGATYYQSFNRFCDLLLNSFPNLKTLSWSALEFDEDSLRIEDLNSKLPGKKHEHLQRICLSNCDASSYQPLLKIFQMCPNLEAIEQMPYQLMNAVVIAGKGQALKSLSYSCNYDEPIEPWLFAQDPDETLLSAFEKLAQLRPKLRSFSLLPITFQMEDGSGGLFELIEPLIFVILQSSCDSLESLCLCPSESYGYQDFPTLNELKTLEFSDLRSPSELIELHEEEEGDFFPRNISLSQAFPNVSEIIICFPTFEDSIDQYLPEAIISPWGSQIKKLKIKYLLSDAIPLLHNLFPSIQELELSASANCIAELLLELALFWPLLKLLTIDVNYHYDDDPATNLKAGRLDCAFTGLSEEVVDQLLDPSRRDNFTGAEIQSFKDKSRIFQLRDLKQLTLLFNDCWLVDDDSAGKLTRMTCVTNEFGFKLLPDLKVTIGIARNNRHVEAIKAAVKPLAEGSNNIEINEMYFDGFWNVKEPQAY